MLKRVAMWKLKEGVDASRIIEMKTKLESLQSEVDSILSVEVGINHSTSPSAYDIVFIGTFKDDKHLKQFENDTYHLTVGRFVSEIKEARTVVDYYLEN